MAGNLGGGGDTTHKELPKTTYMNTTHKELPKNIMNTTDKELPKTIIIIHEHYR